MDFTYSIFFTVGYTTHIRRGRGVFHPSGCTFNLEHMIWLMSEQYGRPDFVNFEMDFIGGKHGEEPKRLQGPEAKG